MFSNSLCSINIQGALLTPAMGDQLFILACEMFSSHQKWRKIRALNFEGWVATEFQTISLDTITGIEFRARMESEAGTTNCHFIVSDNALRDLMEAADKDGLVHYLYDDDELVATAKSRLTPGEFKDYHLLN